MADVFEKYVTPRPEVNPTIYAYKLNGVTTHDGYIKVGYTDRDVKQRIKEQLHTSAISYTVFARNRQCVLTARASTTMTYTPFLNVTAFTVLTKTPTRTNGTTVP